MIRRLVTAVAVVATTLVVPSVASAGTITLNPTDQGWWSETGFHISSLKNYFVQNDVDPEFENANFFVFDLNSVSETVTGAQLTLFTYDIPQGAVGGVYQLFDVSTPIATLTAAGTGDAAGHAIFGDLGSGLNLGSVAYGANDRNIFLTLTLNTNGIAALNSGLGGLFAVGGSVGTGGPMTGLFGASGLNPGNQLVLTTTSTTAPVPEPASLCLLATGLGGMGARRWR